MKIFKTAAVVMIAVCFFAACNKNKWNPANPQPTDTPDIMVPTATSTVTRTSTDTFTVTETATNTHPWTSTVTDTVTKTLTFTLTSTRTFTRTLTATRTFTLTPTPTPTFYWTAYADYASTGCNDCTISLAVDAGKNAFVSMNRTNGSGGKVTVFKRNFSGSSWAESYSGDCVKSGSFSMGTYAGVAYLGGLRDYVHTVATWHDCAPSCADGGYYTYETTSVIYPVMWQADNGAMIGCDACGSMNDNGGNYLPANMVNSGGGLFFQYYLQAGNQKIMKFNGGFSCAASGLPDHSFCQYNGNLYSAVVSAASQAPALGRWSEACGSAGTPVLGGSDPNAAGALEAAIYITNSGRRLLAYRKANSIAVDYWTGTDENNGSWQELSNGEVGKTVDCMYLKGDGVNAYLSFRDKSSPYGVYVYKIDAASNTMKQLRDGAAGYVVDNALSSSLDIGPDGLPYIAYVQNTSKYLLLKRAAY